MPRLREQDRAQKALEVVRGYVGKGDAKEFRQEVQQLPSRIQACGLGQTLAFYASKGEGKLHDRIGCSVAGFVSKTPRTIDYLEGLMKGDAASYRHQTREALAFAEWLKRYAKALISE
jgi:CRISPR type III-B/RAMP module-associated protein Cmr5